MIITTTQLSNPLFESVPPGTGHSTKGQHQAYPASAQKPNNKTLFSFI